MKRLLLILLLCVPLVGCQLPPDQKQPNRPDQPRVVKQERPVVNPPLKDRQENWLGSQREGSCVWASTITLLRWQGRYFTANRIRQKYGNGEYPDDWAAKMEKEGLRYAFVTNGDVRFLEWACRTRRGAGVTVMGGAHMLNLVHLDDKWACLLDNNNTGKYKWLPREMFLAEWRASHGWGLTVVYTPTAPLPQ